MNNQLRAKAAKELAKSLNCTEEVANIVLDGMDKEAKDTKKLFEECAAEMD